MDGVTLPYLPVSLWILTGAMSILILFVAFGFYIHWRNWAKEVSETGSDLASLKARKLILEKEKDSLEDWLRVHKDELDRVKAEREEQERIRAVLADLEQQCAVKNQENQALRNEVGELENQRHHLAQTLDRMQHEIGDLDAKRTEAEAIDLRLAEMRSRLEEGQQTIRNLAELEVKLNSLSNEKASLERAVEDLHAAADLARTEADRWRREAAEARVEFEKIELALAAARNEKAGLGSMLHSLGHDKHKLETSIDSLKEKIESLKLEIENFKASSRIAQEEAKKHGVEAIQALADLDRVCQELALRRKDRELLDSQLGELNARKALLEREISRLEGKPRPEEDSDPLAAYADLISGELACLDDDRFSGGPMTIRSEEEALQELQEILSSEGLYFSERVLNAFHTSLKVNDIIPLTVLAGVSGTGKSLLPVKYAEVMGMHSLIVSVQPRWDSPQDLFGFYNYLDHKYKATDLARALVRMDEFNFTPQQFSTLREKKRHQRMLLVLLDEMNLARTEYYFSEFLSKLEFRKFSKDPSKGSHAEIVLDTGPRSKDAQSFRLSVGGNVLFVGTMNEDESTQTLSDKVLDRANVLRFGKPPEKENQDDNGGKRKRERPKDSNHCYFPYSVWKSWFREPGIEPWRRSVDSLLSRLNDALNILGRPFGYRVRDAIHAYIANYPGAIHNGKLYKTALADQVELKLLPKLRGIEVSENAQPLNRIEEVIRELGDEMLLEQFHDCRERAQNTTNLFTWRGVERPL